MSSLAPIGLTNTYILNADISINDAQSGFQLHAASITGDVSGVNSGIYTGLSISGVNGAIFNDAGQLIGGFQQGRSFNLQIQANASGRSIYKDGVLLQTESGDSSLLTDIKVEKEESSLVNGTLETDEICVFAEESGISVFVYDNEVFLCP